MADFKDRLLTSIRALFREKAKPTNEDLSAIIRKEVAREGGLKKGQKAKERKEADSTQEDSTDKGKVAASDETVPLADLAFEQRAEVIQAALQARYGDAYLVRTYADRAIYMTGGAYREDGPSPMHFWEQSYSLDEEKHTVEFTGERTEVQRVEQYEPVLEDALLLAENADVAAAIRWLKKAIARHERHMNGKEPTTGKAGDASQQTMMDEMTKALDNLQFGGSSEKQPAPKRRSSAMKMSDEGAVAAQDDEGILYSLSEAFLQPDASGTLPEWIQIHRIGEWAVEHATAGKIEMTREMGDSIIRNFHAGVVRQGVPLDERHLTDDDGPALAWFEDVRWGSDDQGLPGQPVPDGVGSIIYGKPRYNENGIKKLGDDHYKYISPQYHRDYVDKETGLGPYGPTLLAVAATNRPYLRLRSIKGEPVPEPVPLSDTRRNHIPQAQEATTMPEQTPGQQQTPATNPQPYVSLSDHQALQQQMATMLSERRNERIDALVSEKVREGIPPALADSIGRIMKAVPETDATQVRLSDKPEDQPVRLEAALVALFDQVGKTPFGTRTRTPDEQRPANGSVAALDDAYTQEQNKVRQQMGLPVPAADGTTTPTAPAPTPALAGNPAAGGLVFVNGQRPVLP